MICALKSLMKDVCIVKLDSALLPEPLIAASNLFKKVVELRPDRQPKKPLI